MRLINQYHIFIQKVRETKSLGFTLSELIYKLIDSQLNTTRILDLVGKWDDAINIFSIYIIIILTIKRRRINA
jgi:hypothetical protein